MTVASPAANDSGASLGADYFDAVYAGSDDPWSFETSDYERGKYARTLAALPNGRRFARGFELGCSIGVLTAQLASRCDALLGIDVADKALAVARRRTAAMPQVTLQRMSFPDESPPGRFDLVVVSEVGYYWSASDLARAADRIVELLLPGGWLLLVHWIHPVADYPLTGDAVHEAFFARADGGALAHRHGERHADYRLDAFERA